VKTLDEKKARLDARLAELPSVLIAYSGGIDSAFLAWTARQISGLEMMAVLADSPSLARAQRDDAVRFAQDHAIPLEVITTAEMENPDYVRNDLQRCFHCKSELFTRMEEAQAQLGFRHLAYGMNLDDRGDFRPGQNAAREHGVVAPLVEAGLNKADVRELAHAAGLPVWDKPASACLSSRLEYGRPVSREALAQVEQAEDALHNLGLLEVRVRHHGDLARIELSRSTLALGVSLALLNDITAAVKAAGFTYVALDTEGYRSGSMNAILPIETLLAHKATPHAS
jgi:uncharacterized protein